MAVRFIREDGDEILRKVSKKVDVIDERIKRCLMIWRKQCMLPTVLALRATGGSFKKSGCN